MHLPSFSFAHHGITIKTKYRLSGGTAGFSFDLDIIMKIHVSPRFLLPCLIFCLEGCCQMERRVPPCPCSFLRTS
jgi:hypothetical protein